MGIHLRKNAADEGIGGNRYAKGHLERPGEENRQIYKKSKGGVGIVPPEFQIRARTHNRG